MMQTHRKTIFTYHVSGSPLVATHPPFSDRRGEGWWLAGSTQDLHKENDKSTHRIPRCLFGSNLILRVGYVLPTCLHVCLHTGRGEVQTAQTTQRITTTATTLSKPQTEERPNIGVQVQIYWSIGFLSHVGQSVSHPHSHPWERGKKEERKMINDELKSKKYKTQFLHAVLLLTLLRHFTT